MFAQSADQRQAAGAGQHEIDKHDIDAGLIVVFQLIRPGASGTAEVPGFVWGIVISLFLFFNIFALNQWLQYKRVGRWSNYLYGEKWYIILSLVAKSLLAWQVFAGTLVPPA